MTQTEELTPYELFGTYRHIGIVVRDIDAYGRTLKEMFGYEPSGFGETPPDETRRYKGEYEDFKARMAFYNLEGTMLELLMPIQGKNVWQDYLDEKGEGIHHLNFDVIHYDKAVAHLTDLGLPIVMSGTSFRRPGCRWCYVDAREKIGMYLEIAELP